MSYDNNRKVYFAADTAENAVDYLKTKSESWFTSLSLTNYLDKVRRSWLSYNGSYFESGSGGHEITFGGEQGELSMIAVNHYRNLGQHMLSMVTASRPSFQARAVNTDAKSQMQTKLANGLLEYYMRDKRLEKYLKDAVEYAIVMGSGYIKMEWNSTAGELIDWVEDKYEEDEEGNIVLDEEGEPVVLEKGMPIYDGDVAFTNLSPLDVVFDSTKESADNHDWVLVRTFINRFSLAAKYPEQEDEIVGLQTKSDLQKTRVSITPYDETEDVPVYELFHKPTEAKPEGRYIRYCDRDVILVDKPLDYDELPVYRISPSDILGTPYGYTGMFDLLPLQDAVNTLYSTILTNQSAFGVQNVLSPRGSDISVSQLSSNMNFIEYNAQAGAPSPLNLTNTPGEIFNFLQILERSMETISGINAVARGNPEKQLTSGNALALVQSQALQFISGLQQSYILLIEDVGTGLVKMIKKFATSPRVAAIAGESNKAILKSFSGADLDLVNRVIVDAGNALAQTTAGRVQIAESLLQMQQIQSPEQYMSVINTGKLEVMTENQNKELMFIKEENEDMLDGKEVFSLASDNHSLHIREHKSLLLSTEARRDPALIQMVETHIKGHMDLLRQTDPDYLAVTGQQPLSPMGGTGVGLKNAAPPQPPQQAMGQMPGLIDNPQAQQLNPQAPLPQPAQPAGQEILGDQPQNAEQLFAKNTGQ